MFERNDDVLFVCYDNEAYMNTGVQRSGATPPAARTANTKPVGEQPGNVFGQGKNVPLIAMAHEIPYVATATVAELRDLEAQGGAGDGVPRRAIPPRLRPLPARLGIGVAATRSGWRGCVKETGLFPVFEAEHGEVVGVSKIRRRVPVEEYLKLQRRYAHLFGDPPAPDVVERLQAHGRPQHRPLRPARRGRSGARHDGVNGKPFAITLDVGSSLRQQDRHLAHRARRLRRPAAALQRTPAPPARTSRHWLYHAEEGDGGYERAWRQIMEDNPFPAIMGRVCYHPCETACNRGQLDEAVGINSVERFLGDEAIERGWQGRGRRRQPSGKRVLVVGAGPSGLSAAYHLARLGHDGDDPRRRADGRRDDALRHPQVPAAARRARRRGRSGSSTWASSWSWTPRSRTSLEAMREGGFDAAFLAVGAHIGRRAYIPAGDGARILDAVSMLRSMEEGERPLLGRRVVGLRRRRHRDGRGPHRQAPRRHRRGRRLPAHPRPDARPRLRGRGGRGGGRADALALDDQARRARASCMIERMELDETGFPQPTGELEELEADSLVLALGQEADLSLLDGVPGIEVEDGVVEVGPNMMTGHAGIFAGGDMVPAERTVTVGVGHGKKAARNIDAWLRGERATSRPPTPSSPPSTRSTPGTTPTRRRRCSRGSKRRAGESTFDEVVEGPRRGERALRGAALHVVRQLLLLRQLLRRLPRQRGDQARRARRALRDRLRLLQGLRHLRRRVPLRRDRDGARARACLNRLPATRL